MRGEHRAIAITPLGDGITIVGTDPTPTPEWIVERVRKCRPFCNHSRMLHTHLIFGADPEGSGLTFKQMLDHACVAIGWQFVDATPAREYDGPVPDDAPCAYMMTFIGDPE